MKWQACFSPIPPVLLPAVAIHKDEEPTITRLSSTLSNQKVAMLLASVPAHLHKDSIFANRIKPVACRTTQGRIKCVLITIMQSSIPELLTATYKLPALTPPYLSVQKLIVLQWRSLLVEQLTKCHADYNNLVHITRICHRAVLSSGYRPNHILDFYIYAASTRILF